MRRRQRRLFTVWGVLSFVLVASVLWIGLLSAVARGWQDYAEQQYATGYEAGKSEVVIIEDEPVHTMPLYLQEDPRWSDQAYGGGTIGTHGCGLTSAAMAMTFIKGEYISPASLATMSGDAFITDGVNDPDKICQWLLDNYGVQWSGEKWHLDEALELVDQGWLVIAGMEGYLGEEYYGGHDVLIYARSGDGYLIRDPADGDNSVKLFTIEELQQVQWGSFNAIR